MMFPDCDVEPLINNSNSQENKSEYFVLDFHFVRKKSSYVFQAITEKRMPKDAATSALMERAKLC